MAALSFQPTKLQLILSWAVFVVCLVAAAWLGSGGHEGFGWALAHDVVQAAGAAALALGGIGFVLSRLARRRWEPATQAIAVDQLHAAVRHAGAVMAAAADVVLGEPAEVGRIDAAFGLPWTARREAVVEEVVGEAGRQATEVVLGHRADAILERLAARSGEVSGHADGLFAAAAELDSFLPGDHVLPLLAVTSNLRRQARVLADVGAKQRLEESIARSRAAIEAVDVLRSGRDVARRLREPFDQIREGVKDPQLREELESDVNRVAFDESLDRWQAETDAAIASLDAAMAKVARRPGSGEGPGASGEVG